MDYAYDQTERMLHDLEKKIAVLYSRAAAELQGKIDAYFGNLISRDERQRELMEAGQITKEQYQLWRLAQLGRGERYIALQNEIAQRCNEANVTATAYVNDATPGIYSLNYNYSAYTIEKTHGNVGFTLFDEQTVRRLLVDDPELFPTPRVDIPVDLKWNLQKLQRELVSGIMQGESIGKLADRFQSITDMNRVSALRNARTAVTGAQNAGRQESYERAAAMGIHKRKCWRAVKDGRTRHSHGMLDGKIVDAEDFFISELGSRMLYPGDRDHGAEPADLYNCRCGMQLVEEDGIEAEPRMMRVRNPKYTMALEEENKLRQKYERALAKEQAETDAEKRKILRDKRLSLQRELAQNEKHRKSITKNMVVNDMKYSEWLEWKQNETAIVEQHEKSVKYGDDAIHINRKYIASQAYRIKYRGITSKPKVDDIVCRYSREILTQKSGTENEVLILLDADNGNLIYRKDNKSKNRVDYSKALIQAIERAKKEEKKILAIHNHPSGFPPTADDCVSATAHGYSLGVVCGHNGKVYTYKPAERMYTEAECTKIHNAISMQLMGTDDIDRTWIDMLKLYKLEADVR